jgi:broad specificity phosphatase PhoE
VIIETSPFIRCLQTASEIAKILGVPRVTVNYRFSEFLSYEDFGHSGREKPMHKMELTKFDFDYQKMKREVEEYQDEAFIP